MIPSFMYHMTHYRNLQRIMHAGILSHALATQSKLTSANISSSVVQALRHRKQETVYRRVLHDYAPFYLNPRNPMLYIRQYIQHAVVMLAVSTDILKNRQYIITDGNAASNKTVFSTDETILDECRDVLTAADWRVFPDGKRKRCAEILVFPKVESACIHHVVCPNQIVADIARVVTGRPAYVDASFYFEQG